MSKRKSVGNTLFNYFTKTPPSNKKLKTNIDDSNKDLKQKLIDSDTENKIESWYTAEKIQLFEIIIYQSHFASF